MIFRKNGLYIHCYVREAGEDGKLHAKSLHKFSADCTEVGEVPVDILKQLSDKELQQLAKYFERQERQFNESRKRRAMQLPHTQVLAAARQITSAFDDLDLHAVLKPVLKSVNEINEGTTLSGYMPEMLVGALRAATADLKKYRLEKDHAQEIIAAWTTFKDELSKQGYTTTWYNEYTKKQ